MAKDKGSGDTYVPPPDPLENRRPKNTDKAAHQNEQPRSSDPRRKGN